MKKNSTLKWIFDNSKKQRVKIVLLLIGNALFSLLSVVFALLIREIIDSASVHKDVDRLISFAVAIICVVFLQFGFRVFINALTENIKARLELDYKSQLFRSILNKKHEKLNGYHSGELLTRLTSDVSIVSDGVSSILPTVVSALSRLICAVVVLVVLDPIFALAFFVAGSLVFLVITFLREKLKGYHKKTQETDGKVRSFMQECIENLLAVKVFAVNEKIEGQANALQEKNYKIKMKRMRYSVVGHATYNFIFSAGYLFALIYGGVKILNGVLTYGSLSAILQLVNNVQVPFASLSNVLPKYYAMIASAERIMEIEEVEEEPKAIKINKEAVYKKMNGIAIENVSFTYDRDKVLDNASIYINKGDFVAITGTSGVGKSTLMKLMLGVYPLDSGKVYIDSGEPLALDNSTRPLFSYVPQGNMLFSGTLRDNVTFIRSDASDEEIDRALTISLAKQFIDQLPEGLNTVVGENGVGLSEGQIQRIAIARAVLTRSPILLLDEATSALDEHTEKMVLDNLKTIEDITLIIVTHKKAALEICNRNIQIKQKKIYEK
ncbi:MAG: ABC transporter ATP-binding protein [Clostridiales bacterium]|nr:ABC transporter ATP-binding protein [Clostridiales bacterium]